MRFLSVERSKLSRWDVKYQDVPRWDPSLISILYPLGDLARRRVESAAKDVPLGSISFGGQVTPRGAERTSKSTSFLAKPGDVVFSRIDIRNGAIGVLPEEYGDLAFSGEYPIYNLSDTGVLRPDYMRLLCRTTVFRGQVNAQVVGHSGRRRLPAEEFEKLLVPVPPLAQQDELLIELEARKKQAEVLRQEALPLISEAGAAMLAQLGVEVPAFEVKKRPFVVGRSKVLRWSVRKGMAAKQGAVQEISSPTHLHLLGDPDLSTVSYGVTKNPKNRPGKHARPYLRVANVQDGFLDLRVMKNIDVPPNTVAQYELQTGDLLLCEGNSRDLVGRPAMWQGEIDGCVHQNHVLRVRVNRERLLPEFVLAYMHGPAGRWYFGECAKQTTNLATINSSDVKSLPIPVPDLARQAQLAGSVVEARSEAERLLVRAAALESEISEWLASRLGSLEISPDADLDEVVEGSAQASVAEARFS